jgi:hypothetical protein
MWMSRDVEGQLIELERRLSDCVIDMSAALNLGRWGLAWLRLGTAPGH